MRIRQFSSKLKFFDYFYLYPLLRDVIIRGCATFENTRIIMNNFISAIHFPFLWHPALYCSLPDVPDNGVALLDGKTQFAVGDIVHFECNDYYVFQGDTYNKCGMNGEWAHDSPQCGQLYTFHSS